MPQHKKAAKKLTLKLQFNLCEQEKLIWLLEHTVTAARVGAFAVKFSGVTAGNDPGG